MPRGVQVSNDPCECNLPALHISSRINKQMLSTAKAVGVFGFVVSYNRQQIIVRFMRFGFAATDCHHALSDFTSHAAGNIYYFWQVIDSED